MKKTISLMLMMIMVFGLAACGGGGSSQPAGQSSGASTSSSTGAPPPGQPTMNVTMPGPDSNPIPAGTEVIIPASDEPQYGGVVKMVTNADLSAAFGLPWKTAISNATQPIVPFGECLVLESTGGDIFPWLATDWEIDDVKKEVRLNLREDVWFSDGSKFNADVVVWNYTMARAEGPGYLNPAIDHVEARGEYAVAVVMANDTFANNILNILSSHVYAIASKENFDKFGMEYAGEHPVGTGPFILTEKVPGVGVKYVRNDDYWQKGKPYLDGFEFVVIPDAQTQINAMMAPPGPSRVDVLNNPGVEQLAILAQDPELTIYAYPSGVTCLYPSSRNPESPFADLKVRQAVSFALDREALAAARGFGFQHPATQFVPKGYYGHFNDERNYFEYNPDKARQLLTEAGYPNGIDTKYYASTTSDWDMATAITKMLEDVGIRCDMEFLEGGAFTALRSTNGWDEGLVYTGFGSLASMPTSYRLALDPQYAYNKGTQRPEGYDEAYAALYLTLHFDQKLAEVTHGLLADNMTMIPMLWSVSANVTRNSIIDAEYGYWAVGTQWLPSEMWLKQ